MHTLRTLAWILCGIYATIPAYWMMVHPFTRQWKSRQHKLKLLAPLWVLMWCAAWAIAAPWRETLLYRNPGTWVAAPILWAVSVFMYVNGGRELTFMRLIGRNELEPERHPHTLITFGVHRLVRHPLYLGHLCTMLGWTIGAGSVACYGLLAWAVATGAVMIVYEERELHERFGLAWEEYCAQTPAIFPVPKH